MSKGLLSDVKVLELSSVLAGPLVGSFFSELGAQVTKIENKISKGDVTRQWKLPQENREDAYSAYYCAANYQKNVLFLDLKNKEDRAQLETMLASSDVVLSNFQKRVAQELDLEPEKVHAKYPQLIFAQLNAYSYDDPRPGYDLVMQAETGYISMNGTESGDLCKMPVAMIDILAAHQMKEAILLALINKIKTNLGAVVHISLYKSGISGLANQASNFLMENFVPKPIGTLHPNIAPYGDIFHSRDGKMFILAIGSDDQFKKLWNTLSFSGVEYHNFDSNSKRISNRILLKNMLQSFFYTSHLQELSSIFEMNNLPYCLIKDLSEVFDCHLASGMVNIEILNTGKIAKSVSQVAFDFY